MTRFEFHLNYATKLTFVLICIRMSIACTNTSTTSENQKPEEALLELNEDMCTQFAVKLHESFVNNDTLFLQSYINWEYLKLKTIAYANTNDTLLSNYIWNKIKNTIHIGKDFSQINAMGGSIRFITYYKENDAQHHIILRSFYPPQNINFYDFTLTSKGAFLKINDIYSYEMACNLDQLLGEQLSAMQTQTKSIEAFEEYYKNLTNKIQEAQKLSQEGKLNKAYKTLISIDETFKSTQYYQALELSLLNNSTDELIHKTALEKRIKKISIEEPGRWLLLFYQSGLDENYEQGRLCIQNLEDYAGEDDMLTFLKGITYFEERDYQKALSLFNTALASEQDFYIIHYSKIVCLLELKQYDLAIESLELVNLLFNTNGFNWDKELMAYPDFLMSDVFEKWYGIIDDENTFL